MVYQVQHYINGALTASDGRELAIYNPSVGEKAGRLNVADSALVDNAVQAAHKVFSSWSATPSSQRAKILFKFKSLLDDHIDELAAHVTREHGKTHIESVGSIQRGIDVLEFACSAPFHLKGSYAESVARGIDSYSLHQPLGVCVGITPFNFPAMIGLWMFPLAIACGNTFIWKPSEKNPSVAVKIAELAKRAGLPDGVLNVIHGDKQTVDALIDHPDVKAVSFVGSSAVAKQVYQQAILKNKRAQAFGGAKNHCIVMPDADLHKAAEAITISAFGSAGERCMALPVVLTVGDIGDQLAEKISTCMSKLTVGPGDDKKTDIGPLITAEHMSNVAGFVDDGVKARATLLIDGRGVKLQAAPGGFYMGPCLFDHVTKDMRIYQEEIFGPVLCMLRCKDFEEAITLINQHQYGNGTAIFTRDGYTARQFSHRVQVGMVGVNVPIPVPVPVHSFGGWKNSIFADIGMFGTDAIRFYTKHKTVTQKWLANDKAGEIS